MNILILNGSPNGSSGNTARLSDFIQKLLQSVDSKKFPLTIASHKTADLRTEAENKHSVHSVCLIHHDFKDTLELLDRADIHIYLTGTYWDGWGSPLQKFLEDLTPYEGSKIIFGKPAGVFVLMHSVGGKGICSRLQGVLNTFGNLIPPMSGWVYSLVSQLAVDESDHSEDFWSMDDVEVVLQNLLSYAGLNCVPNLWKFDSKDARRVWLKVEETL